MKRSSNDGCSWQVVIVGLLALLALAGCRSVPVAEAPAVGSVGVALVTPPADAAPMQLESSEGFVFPNLIEPVAMPEYPPDLLPLRLDPLELCVDVTISAEGLVSAAKRRIDDMCPGVAGEHEERFAAALLETVGQWTYDPALVCRTPDARASAHACAEPDVLETPTALRLSYAFRFSQQDGRPAVELRGGAAQH